MLETLTRPELLHAAMVHFPVALALLGVPVVYLCALYGSESRNLLRVAAAGYAILTVSAVVAMFSGIAARQGVPNTVEPTAWELIHRHEWMGSQVWIFAAVTTVLLVLSFVNIQSIRVVAIALAMATSLATAIWVAMTGHYGGILVYDYGVGTPYVMTIEEEPPPVPETPIPDADEPLDPIEDSGYVPIRSIDPDEAAQIQFQQDVWPLLERRCLACHGATRPSSDYQLTSVEAIIAGGSKAAPAVVPGEPDQSVLVQYLRGELQPRMPMGEDPLEPYDLHIIRSWIAAGATDGAGVEEDAEAPE